MTFALDLARGARKILPPTHILKGMSQEKDADKIVILDAPTDQKEKKETQQIVKNLEQHSSAKVVNNQPIICSDQIF